MAPDSSRFRRGPLPLTQLDVSIARSLAHGSFGDLIAIGDHRAVLYRCDVIVSHRHRFVFIRTRKTASGSLQLALAEYCGPGDIVSSFEGDLEGESVDTSAGVGRKDRIPLTGMSWKWVVGMASTRRWPRFYNHSRAVDVRRAIGEQRWHDYTTFAVERNPWDRTVSRYYWSIRGSDAPPAFSVWLDRSVDAGRWALVTNWPSYSDGDEVIVDRLVRFENLTAEMRNVATALGLDGLELPSTKRQFRPDESRDYRSMYNARTADLVAELCSREIEHLGYEF